jgi:hypothetical protein
VHPLQYSKLPYVPEDLVPIARVSNTILAIGVPTSLKIGSLAEFVKYARAEPGKLNAAVVAGITEFTFDYFLKTAGLSIAKVPYRDVVQAATDLSEGRLQVMMSSYAILQPRVQAGSVRALAVNGHERASILPDIPTARESGFPALEVEGLVGLLGPRGISNELRRRIGADVAAVAGDPTIAERLAGTAQVANPGGPAEFAAAIDQLRGQVLEAHQPHHGADFLLLVLAESHDQREGGGLQPLHRRAVGVDDGAVPVGNDFAAARIGLARTPRNIAQRRLDRRPKLILIGRELEPLPDAGDLGAVEHRIAGARRDRRMGRRDRPLGRRRRGGFRAFGPRRRRGGLVRISERLGGNPVVGRGQLRRQRGTRRRRGRRIGTRRPGGRRMGGSWLSRGRIGGSRIEHQVGDLRRFGARQDISGGRGGRGIDCGGRRRRRHAAGSNSAGSHLARNIAWEPLRHNLGGRKLRGPDRVRTKAGQHTGS